MKVQVWNAFASNNSGSDTRVGRFPDETLAAELTRVASEHTAWLEERGEKGWGKASPEAMAGRRQGVGARVEVRPSEP